MRMMMKIFSCLSVFVLSCNIADAIIHKIVEQKTQIILPCPHPEHKVTWSREKDGIKTYLMTADDKDTKLISDPYKYYSTLADKSLLIQKVYTSDAGRYLCNDEAAVDLTVIPSGAVLHEASEGTSVTLKCPDVSDFQSWWRKDGDMSQSRFVVSSLDETLIISNLQPADSGLYHCNGKHAAYVNVIRDAPSDREKTTTTVTSSAAPTSPDETSASGNEAETTKPPTTQTTASTVPLTTRKQKSKKKPKKDKKSNEAETTKPPTTQTTASTVPLTTRKQESTKKPKKDKKKKKTTTVTSSAAPTSIDGASASAVAPRVRLGIIILYLVVMISIIVTTWRKARQIERRHVKERQSEV